MDVISFKQFAEEQNVSYEAIRKQIVRYSDELKDHIVRRNRTQYLDEWAVNFLKEKRKENPVILMNMDQNEQIEELKAQVEVLKNQLIVAQNQIIGLQDEAQKAIETKVRNEILLEDNKAKEEKISNLSREIGEIQKEADGLKKQSEENLKEIEILKKERDEFQTEALSYQKSFFGFYRKK